MCYCYNSSAVLAEAEIAFLTKYWTVMTPLLKALNIFQSETNMHMGPVIFKLQAKLSWLETSSKICLPLPQSHSGWCPKTIWSDNERPWETLNLLAYSQSLRPPGLRGLISLKQVWFDYLISCCNHLLVFNPSSAHYVSTQHSVTNVIICVFLHNLCLL